MNLELEIRGEGRRSLVLLPIKASAELSFGDGIVRFDTTAGSHAYLSSASSGGFGTPPAETAVSLQPGCPYELSGQVELDSGRADFWIIEYDAVQRLTHARCTLATGRFRLRWQSHSDHASCRLAIRLEGRGQLSLRDLRLRKRLRLERSQVEQFHRDGYLIVGNALQASDLEPVIAECEEHVDRLAKELAQSGKSVEATGDNSFERRLISLAEVDPKIASRIDIAQSLGERTFEFLRNETVLDLAESLVGPELTCSPIQHLRAKLPASVGRSGGPGQVVPWHQDAAVAWPEADAQFIVNVWIPLADTGLAAGPLQVLPGQHKSGLLPHETSSSGSAIASADLPLVDPVTVEVDRGAVVLLHSLTPHRSLANQSDAIRWSMDLRYFETGGESGRPFHPEFVIRSLSDPDAEADSYSKWRQAWQVALETHEKMPFHRWHPSYAARRREFESNRQRDATAGASFAFSKLPRPEQNRLLNWVGSREAAFYRALSFLTGEERKWRQRGSRAPSRLGTVLEFGVWNGDSLKLIWNVLEQLPDNQARDWKLVGIDSFEGLPKALDDRDTHPFVGEGSFASRSMEDVRSGLTSHGIPTECLKLVDGWFNEVLTSELKTELGYPPVCFVNIDVDYYSSTLAALDWVEELLSDGAIVYFDDVLFYNGNPHKGQLKAISDFNAARTESGLHLAHRFDPCGRVYVYWRNTEGNSEALHF